MKLYSPPRQKIQDEYLEIREDFLSEVRHCEARLPEVDCQMRADQIQHLVSRSARRELIPDPRNFMAVCGFCHRWIEEHPKEAELRGFTVLGHDWEWLVDLHLTDTMPESGSWENRLVVELRRHGRPDLFQSTPGSEPR